MTLIIDLVILSLLGVLGETAFVSSHYLLKALFTHSELMSPGLFYIFQPVGSVNLLLSIQIQP